MEIVLCMSDISFQPVTSENQEDTIAFLLTIFPNEEKRIHITMRGSLRPEEYTEELRAADQRVRCSWVAYAGTAIVGAVGLYEEFGDADTVCWIGWFCTHPDFRRQGIGSALLDHAINIARSTGKHTIQCYTSTRNADAQPLYEKFGFNIVRTVQDEDHPDSMILYRTLELSKK